MLWIDLQTRGVSAADSADYATMIVKIQPARPIQVGEPNRPTCLEVYGQGNIV